MMMVYEKSGDRMGDTRMASLQIERRVRGNEDREKFSERTPHTGKTDDNLLLKGVFSLRLPLVTQ